MLKPEDPLDTTCTSCGCGFRATDEAALSAKVRRCYWCAKAHQEAMADLRADERRDVKMMREEQWP